MAQQDSVEADHNSRLRLLENWLPLVQAENSTQQWGLNPKQLEALIIKAAPALRTAQSQLSARAILWFYHKQMIQEAS